MTTVMIAIAKAIPPAAALPAMIGIFESKISRYICTQNYIFNILFTFDLSSTQINCFINCLQKYIGEAPKTLINIPTLRTTQQKIRQIS